MWFKNLFKKSEDKKQSPEEMINQTIVAMEQAVQKSKVAFEDALQRKEAIGNKLVSFQEEANKLQKEATQALKRKNEKLAKTFLERKTTWDIQVKDYKKVYDEVAQTVQKLEIQLNKMRLQLEQTRAKKTLLIAQLSQAESQKEIAEQLKDLNLSTDSFEEEIILTQLDANSEQDDFAQELDDFDKELLETNSIKQLEKEIEKEEKEKEQAKKENLQKKLNVLFASTQKKEKEIEAQKKKEIEKQKSSLLQNFFEASDEQENYQNKLALEHFLEDNKKELTDIEAVKKAIDEMAHKKNMSEEKQKDIEHKQDVNDKKDQLIQNFFEASNQEEKEKNKTLLEAFLNENESEIEDAKSLKDAIKNDENTDKDKQIENFFHAKNSLSKKMNDFFNKS